MCGLVAAPCTLRAVVLPGPNAQRAREAACTLAPVQGISLAFAVPGAEEQDEVKERAEPLVPSAPLHHSTDMAMGAHGLGTTPRAVASPGSGEEYIISQLFEHISSESPVLLGAKSPALWSCWFLCWALAADPVQCWGWGCLCLQRHGPPRQRSGERLHDSLHDIAQDSHWYPSSHEVPSHG